MSLHSNVTFKTISFVGTHDGERGERDTLRNEQHARNYATV